MSCQHVRTTLLEQAPDQWEPVQAHLNQCPSCRQVAGCIRQADSDLAAAINQVVDPPLTQPKPAPRRFSMSMLATGVAIAAALLLALNPPAFEPHEAESHPASLQAAERALDLTDETSTIPWDALNQVHWGERRDLLTRSFAQARGLRQAQKISILLQIGRSAENANDNHPDYYGPVGGMQANRAWAAAVLLERQQPGSWEITGNDELTASFQHLQEQLPQELSLSETFPLAADALLAPSLPPLPPKAKPAPVPPLPPAVELADHVSTIPWNALNERHWQDQRDALASALAASDGLRDDQLVAVLVQLGRAAENANDPLGEYFGKVGGTHANRAWAAAALIERENPGSMKAVRQEEVAFTLRTLQQSLPDQLQPSDAFPLP